MLSHPYVPAERFPGGICRGTLSVVVASSSSSSSGVTSNKSISAAGAASTTASGSASTTTTTTTTAATWLYCELVGHVVFAYESAACFQRGDGPLYVWETVGNAAVADDPTSFRLVTCGSTHIYCSTTHAGDRQVWLVALQTGLEFFYLRPHCDGEEEATKNSESSSSSLRYLSREKCVPSLAACQEAAAKYPPPAVRPTLLFFRAGTSSSGGGSAGVSLCVVCQNPAAAGVPCIPMGYETRQAVCGDCAMAQGLLDHLWRSHQLQTNHQMEQAMIREVRQVCANMIRKTQTNLATESKEEESTDIDNDAKKGWDDSTSSLAVMADDVHLDESLTGWPEYLQSPEFQTMARQCPALQPLCQPDCCNALEVLDELCGISVAADLKKQAFTVAASDMGTALQLLQEQAFQPTDNTVVLQAVLEFLLNLCQQGELNSVAFFWPQLCHLHLRMLPAVSSVQLKRSDLMQDFLWTVATQFSIHLALELVWSHVADLEESFQQTQSVAVSSSSKDASTASSSMENSSTDLNAISPHCRRRRWAVLQFVCELESLLFDFEGGWGGGSVSLGHLLRVRSSRSDTVQRLREAALAVMGQRQPSPFPCSVRRLGRIPKTPEQKLTLARNADYFSSHVAFSRRLADVAEKLRFLEVGKRASVLEEELVLLNSSGMLGGDPLNRCGHDHLTRVVRVPPTEGHVFRSKERTPVLLLIEVVTELNDDAVVDESKDTDDINAPTQLLTKEENIVQVASSNEAEIHGSAAVQLQDAQSFDADISTAAESVAPTVEVISEHSTKPSRASSSSPAPSLASLEDGDAALQPHKHSPGPKALKRFDHGYEITTAVCPALLDGPKTPREDIQIMLNSVAEEQLKNIVLPELSADAPETRNSTERLGTSPNKVPRSGLSTVKRVSALGGVSGSEGDSTNTLAPTGDIRRAVLTTIMMRGLQGNTIAAGAADSAQRSLQVLERKRATELLLSDDSNNGVNRAKPVSEIDSNGTNNGEPDPNLGTRTDSTRQKLESLGFDLSLEEVEIASRPSEEDECMEAIRLMLIQNRVAQGQLSPADAAKVLQHTSLSPSNKRRLPAESFDGPEYMDMSDHPTIDAGDVDPRLVGCGPLPPAVLQALTLWKGDMVTHAELLELVKRDIEFVKHSILVDAESVNKLQENSAFWGRFAFGERWAEKKARIGNSSPEGSIPGWDLIGVIVKSNDDLRQEAFVMQLIELSQEAFEIAGLELWLSPYRILATGRTTGIIECVRNAMSFDALKKRPGYGKGGLRGHLRRMSEFTADPGGAFKTAQQNFVRSLAAYSLLSYFFLFKDRHNGNLLLDTAAHVVHIDFGFVFGSAPGGSFSLEMSTPFKLTEEMLDVMGGLRSPLFSEFVTLFCCGFLALQQHCDTFLTMVEITSKDSTFKCFEGRDSEKVVAELRERFQPDLSKEDTVSFALDLIKQATTSYGTRQYDLFQYLSQGILA